MKTTLTFLSMLGIVSSLVGCTPSAEGPNADDATNPAVVMEQAPPVIDGHEHPEHGPHGGELVELGGEAMHIEIVHGDRAVEFYVLDQAAVEPVAIRADAITASLKHEGTVKAFPLAAAPQPGEAEGSASRFASSDPQFTEWIEAGAEGAVSVVVDGTSFTGEIHHHEH